MPWNKFIWGAFLVVMLTFAKSQVLDYWVPIEFSFFLIFLVIRSSGMVRALAFTFLLSMGLDFLFQSHQIKGLATMSQLLLVFCIMNLKTHVIPQFEDIFLLGFFAIFYIANYYLNTGLGALLGEYVPKIHPTVVLFLALFHTACFGLLLVIIERFRRSSP